MPLRYLHTTVRIANIDQSLEFYCKKLGMNPCSEAIEFLYERYYNKGRCPRASDCRDLLETVQSICRFRRLPVQLTKQLMIDAATSFIREFV